MTTKTKKSDFKIINSGMMQYVVLLPAEGRLLRITKYGSALAASVADNLGSSADAIPFSRALGSLQVVGERQDVTIWSGPLPYEMRIPVEGRLIRVTDEGGVVGATVEDKLGHTRDADPFTHAFRSLHVEPVLASNDPFKPYQRGWVQYQDREHPMESADPETSQQCLVAED
jgi:hypothetical protein